MVSNSFRDQGNHLQVSLDDDNAINIPFSKTTFSSTIVCMNFLDSAD
jgi:hypothetical protein